jgi:hypothetical protein
MRYSEEDEQELELDDEPEIEPDLRDELDADFPLGDGTADTTTTVFCPYCAEENEIGIDPGGGSTQQT